MDTELLFWEFLAFGLVGLGIFLIWHGSKSKPPGDDIYD